MATGVMHPIDVLMEEHEILLPTLAAIERECAALGRAGPVAASFWPLAADFLIEFADRRHHAKEDEILIPALLAQGVDPDGEALAVVAHEHGQCRELAERLRASVAAGDAAGVARAAAAYAFLLRDHIQQENMVLFDLARRVLPPDVAERMLARFDEIDRAGGRPARDWTGVAAQLCAEAGVDFRAPGRAAGCGGSPRPGFDV